MFRIAFIISFAFSSVFAQPSAYDKWYELTSVPETATGFMFHGNGTFEFYYIYGAVDRYASGSWHESGDKIILNNSPKPPLDFRLVTAEKKAGKSTSVKIKSINPDLISNIHCLIAYKDSVIYAETNQEGVAAIERRNPSKIELIHGYFPQRSSVFVVKKGHNYFEFEVENWIADVEFRDFILVQEDGNLTGSHPLIDKVNCIYYAPE